MKKNFEILNNIFRFIDKDLFLKNDFYLKVFDRNLIISNDMIGLKIALYNGKYFIPFKITENMLGKIIGSFSFSRNILLIGQKKKYKRKKIKKK